MKKIRGLVIGGIQSKVFNLILFTVILLTAANAAVSLYHSSMLSKLASDSGLRQQQAIDAIASPLMDEVVSRSLSRAAADEARIADGMFNDAARRVTFMADRAGRLLEPSEDQAAQDVVASSPDRGDGWAATVIYADGVNAADPAVASRAARLTQLSDALIALCRSFGAADGYVALPEGVHLSVNDDPGSWIEDGRVRSYDPRERNWYRQAVQAGGLVFTEGEYDANTGAYCVECAAPVYAGDGSLLAVVGTDLFLDNMQRMMQASSAEGEYQLLISQSGRAVLEPQAAAFPMSEADRGADLRASESEVLAQVVSEALSGSGTGVRQGQLADGGYYITAEPIEATGWVLLSAYDQSLAGQPVEWLVDQTRQIQEEAAVFYRDRMRKSRLTAVVLLIAVMALALAGALMLSGRIIRPLNTIIARISNLGDDHLEFRMEDAYRTGDEVEAMAQSFADLSHKTVEYLETVKRVTAEKERIGAELSLATRIQSAMLPHVFPPFPDRREFDIYAMMDPAKEVGGDFYDYFLVDDDHLGIVMADVSGKGVPAALFMMASKIILANNAMMGKSPAQVLTDTNAAICSNNQEEMFVTVWLGILEISTGRLTASNAGHEYPVLRRANGAFELYKDRHGFVIGGMAGLKYRDYALELAPGDALFVYTDGVPEATDAEGQMLGTEGMLAALNASPDTDPARVLARVRRAVDDFVGDAEQFDDLTMLCMDYKGADAPGHGADADSDPGAAA